MWRVVSWIGLFILVFVMLTPTSEGAAVIAIAASYGALGSIALLFGAPIVIGILVLGVFDSLPRQKCSYCGGSGVIAAGAWTSIYDAHDCPHCAGSGFEPVDTSGVSGGW